MRSAVDDPIRLEVLRNRLLSVISEAETALLKASFSTIISLSQDFAVDALDPRCRGLAHSRRSVSEFSALLPLTMRSFLEKHPVETLEPGDILLTNDPWLCAGHLGDLTIAMPVFKDERVVAFMTTMAHHADIGGTLDDTGARDVYEEGLWIPIVKLYEAGHPNSEMIDLIRANVRVPDMIVGDLNAQIAACVVGGRRILEVMEEFELDELESVAVAISERAKRAMEDAIAALPDGTYHSEVRLDGVDDESLRICGAVTVDGARMTVDYTGSSAAVQSGINSAWIFTYAETVNAVKSALIPDVPSTEGCFEPITVVAPPRSILSAEPPDPVKGRTRTGFHVHPVIFGALAQTVPDRVQAHCGLGNLISASGFYADGSRFHAHQLLGGGMGAKRGLDGISCIMYPTSSGNVPVEVFEARTPLVVRVKEFIPDSGGPGEFRGGLGQRVTLALVPGFDGVVNLSVRPQMMNEPAVGLLGGEPGSRAGMIVNGEGLTRSSGTVVRGSMRLEQGDEVTFIEPGGGGLGRPRDRSWRVVEADLEMGYVTIEHVEEWYNAAETPIATPAHEQAT